VPHGHWKITTFVVALRHNAITAPFVIDEPMNGEIFRVYLDRCLVPTLKPGDIVAMDNLPAHKMTKSDASSGPLALSCAICRRTRPTSTLSRGPSQNSKRTCVKPPNALYPRSGIGSDQSSISSRHTNAKTFLITQDTRNFNPKWP